MTVDAAAPPEARGLARDEVRLLVARPTGTTDTVFRRLPAHLAAGDVVVVNVSATLPAALDGWRGDGSDVVVHFATALDDGTWVVEVRPTGRSHGPVTDIRVGERITLPTAVEIEVLETRPGQLRLHRVTLAAAGSVTALLERCGRPISYGYVPDRWPLTDYQTIFGSEPGSAEMPSAGRPFSSQVVLDLLGRGVHVAPVLLHTGVSSPDAGEPTSAERFGVPAATAALVQHVRSRGSRVIAVGTTVTRALETVASEDGTLAPGEGWTDLVLGPARRARVVDGLLTGWHEPGGSHVRLLEAVAGTELVERAYERAAREGYLWHEFGDSCLLLPESGGQHARS